MVAFNLNLLAFLVHQNSGAWNQASFALFFVGAELQFNDGNIVVPATSVGHCLPDADVAICEKTDRAAIRSLNVPDIRNLVTHSATAKSHAALGFHFAEDLHHFVMAAAVESINQSFLLGRSRVVLDINGHAESLARHGRGPKGLGLNGFLLACAAADTCEGQYGQDE